MSLFVDPTTFQTSDKFLVSLNAEYFIDTSGSTSGSILKSEITSASMFSNYFKSAKIVSWNSCASVVSNFSDLRSTGGTYPIYFVKYLPKNGNLIMVYTDGQINLNDMRAFNNEIKTTFVNNLKTIPIMIVFTVPKFDMTLDHLQKSYINMSIPESFLSLSNDVIILITDCTTSDHRVLMTKGCFNCFETLELTETTLLNRLPHFNFELLKNIKLLEGLPSNIIKLKTCNEYIDLNQLYLQDDLSLEVLEGLCDRTLLPIFNLSSLHNVITRINKKLSENPELDVIRKELFEISTSEHAGTELHKEVINRYNEIKSKKNANFNREKLSAINKLLNYMSEYQKNSTNIAFGSNRANRSTVFDTSELDFLGNCEQTECPILLEEGMLVY